MSLVRVALGIFSSLTGINSAAMVQATIAVGRLTLRVGE